MRKNRSMTVGLVTTKTGGSCMEIGWTKRRPNEGRKVHMRKSRPSRGLSTPVSGVRNRWGMSGRWVRTHQPGHTRHGGSDTPTFLWYKRQEKKDTPTFLWYKRQVKYLQEALGLLESFHRQDTHREGPEVTLVERSSSSRG